MTIGEKLSRLRKENNYTQEQLADLLGVSRQSISKWESNIAYPETEKLIRLSQMYHCSTDYLLNDDMETNEKHTDCDTITFSFRKLHYEKKSKTMIHGVPLWHINLGLHQTAKGIFAIGIRAKGVVSFGLFSMGIISIGLFSLGLVAAGTFALGLLSAGAISAGILTAGAIAMGIFSCGAISIGAFSVGALAIGHFAAIGDYAKAAIAIGGTEAHGSLFETIDKLNSDDITNIKDLLSERVPAYLSWARMLFESFL